MKESLVLPNELSELSSILGRWSIKGSFKDNPDKQVKGWESYAAEKDGTMILCNTEIFTIWPDGKHVYKNTMHITYHEEEKKIVGDEGWIFRLKENVLMIDNGTMRFTGEVNTSMAMISGKWEVRDKNDNWNYWYDKTLIRQS